MNGKTENNNGSTEKQGLGHRLFNMKTAKRVRNILAVLLVIFVLDYFYSTIEGMKNDLNGIRKELDSMQKATLMKNKNRGVVDLSKKSIQPIDERFSMIITGVRQEGAGVVVLARIINSTSLRYSKANFTFKLASKELPFTVKELPPGRAVPLTLRFTDVPLNNIQWGTVTYKSADIIYSVQ